MNNNSDGESHNHWIVKEIIKSRHQRCTSDSPEIGCSVCGNYLYCETNKDE
jgi:hypothetical protein